MASIIASKRSMTGILGWITGFVAPAALILTGLLLFQTIEGAWLLMLPLVAGFSGGLILREWWSVFTAPAGIIGAWLLLGLLRSGGDHASTGLEVSGVTAIIALLTLWIVIPAMAGAALGMAAGVRFIGWQDQ